MELECNKLLPVSVFLAHRQLMRNNGRFDNKKGLLSGQPFFLKVSRPEIG